MLSYQVPRVAYNQRLTRWHEQTGDSYVDHEGDFYNILNIE